MGRIDFVDFPSLFKSHVILSSISEKSSRELDKLSQAALVSWFNMDLYALAELLQEAAEFEHRDAPSRPRLRFLRETLAKSPSLDVYETFYATFLLLDDLDAVYACTGAAIGAIWASGMDFQRYDLWLPRADFLLKRIDEASPLAVTSLLGYKALAELTGQGNLALAVMPYTVQQFWAEKSGSVSLRLLHASTAAFCAFWAGDLTSAELLLAESLPLSKLAKTPVLPALLYQSCLGLCKVIKGETGPGIELLERAVQDEKLQTLSLSVYLHLYTNYLYGLCVSGELVKVQEVATLIMEKTIPPCNYYHLACVHFCLGIASLRLGDARKALLHSERARQRGEMSGSPIIAPLAALIHGQSLFGLQEYEQAIAHFKTWIPHWQNKGFGLFAVTGALEIAAISIRLGEVDNGRIFYKKAAEFLPQGERFIALYRDNDFIQQIEEAVFPSETRPGGAAIETSPSPVTVCTLGSFCLSLDGEPVYDRFWKGRRSKQLLKAIIALGGTKISLERLSYLLWPDSDGDRGGNSLKTALSRLRRVGDRTPLNSDRWLVVKHKRVSLVQSVCRVDALDFQRNLKNLGRVEDVQQLLPVLSLYQGDFLPNDDEPWILSFRDHLRKLFVDGVLRLAALDGVRDDDKLPFLEKAAQIAPLQEDVYACLMKHFTGAGYPVHALEIFRKAEKVIFLHTGLQPGAHLQSLALQAKGILS